MNGNKTLCMTLLPLIIEGFLSLATSPVRFLYLWISGTCEDWKYYERRRKRL